MRRIGTTVHIVSLSLVVLVASGLVSGQTGRSGREYRSSAIMKGNLVKTVFGNWGVIGQPTSAGSRGAWIYENNGYVGDVSPLVGAEIVEGDQVFHSVVVCPVQRPTSQPEVSTTGKQWGFEPVEGYFNSNRDPNEVSVALYSDPDSWPPAELGGWPDKRNDPEDPGWVDSWNGYFGKTTTASEESYFVMDDNNDDEFNVAGNNRWGVAFQPDATDPNRHGLGLEVKVRGMQWRQFLAQDCIFWLYEITNTSTTDYSKVVFGMLVGTYVGVTSTEDYSEYDDDYSFFDVERDLTYTADFDDNASRNPLWTGEVGVVGYAFLESPGNPFDGIDNDRDADSHPTIPATGPLFEASDFDSTLINAGDQIVLIDDAFQRTVVTVSTNDTTFHTRGADIFVSPGLTKLAEGNVLYRIEGGRRRDYVNSNAYDGIDNDLDGLIDENFFLHYRQIRRDQEGNTLIDKLTPTHYIDYVSGLGVFDDLIDERRDDGIDNDGDWDFEFDDVGADGLIGSGDFGEGDGVPTAGEPNFDQTDVDESDQIGLTSFEYFTPAGEFAMGNDEEMWDRLAPGFFEVPSSIINNKPERGEDGDFIYGSGYFPLRAGQTERISLALVYGEGGGPGVDIDDLLKNRETVQDIYNSDYRFPPAPEKPTLTAVPGDGKVTLYWDRRAEASFDPVLRVHDFEGYKIYRATDHNFNDVFQITDADGTLQGYAPLAQFDLDNGIRDYFRASEELYPQTRGYTYFLGDDSGLEHSYVDSLVENGRRYYYALVAYDRGDEGKDILPAENDFRIDFKSTGEILTFQNTAVVVPRAEVIGYVPPPGADTLRAQSIVGTGDVYSKVLHDSLLTGHKYILDFFDTSNDGIDNDGDWDIVTDDVGRDGDASTIDEDGSQGNGLPDAGEPNLDESDAEEFLVPITTSYSVRDSTGITETFVPNDTNYVRLKHAHLIEGTITVRDDEGNVVPEQDYRIDLERGRIRGDERGIFPEPFERKNYTISFQYYPIYKSPNIQNSPYVDETMDTDIFDGLTLNFNNHWSVDKRDTLSKWSDPTRAYQVNVTVAEGEFPSGLIRGLRHPSDYQIQFSDDIVDTTTNEIGGIPPNWLPPPTPVNFRVYNMTDERYVDFLLVEIDMNQMLSHQDEVILVEPGPNDSLILTWDLTFVSGAGTTYTYGDGDTYTLSMLKPFRRGDVFEFTTETPSYEEEEAQEELDAIRVVPNPYVVGTSHEPPLPPGITSGRGTRLIEFRHLPKGATIYIFTSRGEHVKTLYHDNNIYDGTVSWDLKTKENLDIAYGVYFYVVESKVGTKRGKIAIIK
ncbi:MAG: hypothetical protein JSV84_07930 [Gemmatimonadota bacterium]|nr:MAG: hypothetical protein JSV84_07930 [Gemmatimonadota bacterium]